MPIMKSYSHMRSTAIVSLPIVFILGFQDNTLHSLGSASVANNLLASLHVKFLKSQSHCDPK